MSLDPNAILSALESHALSLGYFERVGRHEPDSPPTTGLTAAIWAQQLGIARAASGLTATTALLTFNVRVYSWISQDPPDEIDPVMLTAVSALMDAYTGHFTLGGLIKNVDLLGSQGVPLSADAGYIQQSETSYRVYTITVPLVINDLWTQAA